MAITINEFRLPITAVEARDYLQRETDSFGVFFDVDRCYELAGIMQLQNKHLQEEFNEIAHKRIPMKDKEAVIQLLRESGVSKGEFMEGGKLSLTAGIKDKIAANPVYSDKVKDIVKLHNMYTSNARNKGALLNYAILPNSLALSKYNHRMSIGHPKWKILSTNRLAASDPGVQGIPRSMPDIVTEPKGYTLVRCDSGQIEPRINFSYFIRDELIMALIAHYNDAYFGLLNYCVMTDEQLAECREDISKLRPIEITDDLKERRQSIKRLTNAGSYGSTNLDGIDPSLAAQYERRIVKHPARLALERKVTQDVERGIETFYGAFGTPVTPDSTERYSKGEGGWQGHLIRCGINNPVQATASELMMFSINEARKILSEAKDTHICYYKHDEACFYVSDEDMANGVGDKLKEVTAYNVEGWLPIEADAVFGVKHGDYPTVLAM